MKKYIFKNFLLSFMLLVSFRPSVADPVNIFIQSVSPGMNSVSVNRSSDINIVFTQNMIASTLNSSNIIVNGVYTGVISSNISYNAASKTLTIDPLTDLKTGEKIFVTLKSEIKTENNIPIIPFIYSFICEVTGSTDNYQISDIISNCENVEPGDIDRDGDIDLITFAGTAGIRIFKNNGLGHFSYFSQITDGTSSFVLNDFDLSGSLDIAFYSVDNLTKIFLNDGTGMFSLFTVSPGVFGKTVDFDGDGDPDMASLLGFDLSVLRNDDGYFSITDTIPVVHNCNDGCYPLADYEFDDIDRDGDMDILEVHHTACEILEIFFGCRYVELFRNNGTGSFSKETITSGGISGNHSILEQCNITPINFDGDSDDDILLYNTKLTNIGNTVFEFSGFPFNRYFGKPVVADLDGDRDLDFITLYYAEIYKNDGSGNFLREANSFLNGWIGKINTVDLDNDGDLDIVTVKNNTLIIYMKNVTSCISGPEYILRNSVNLYFSESGSDLYWDISNFDSTQATIISDNHNDSIYVNSGNNFGQFVLYLVTPDSTLCTKNVYIDYPSPVELTSFTSSVSGRDITLNWSASSEINNSGFEVERRDAGSETQDVWVKAGFVIGNGNSSATRNYEFTEKNLNSGKYNYRLKQIDFNGNFEYFELSEVVIIGIPIKYNLSQNYPNPFNPVTNLEFGIPELEFVTLKIYDVLGRELVTLVNEIKEPGYYNIKFNASDLSSGVYFYRMTAGDFAAVKKLVVLK